jgi:hypothetical protein
MTVILTFLVGRAKAIRITLVAAAIASLLIRPVYSQGLGK